MINSRYNEDWRGKHAGQAFPLAKNDRPGECLRRGNIGPVAALGRANHQRLAHAGVRARNILPADLRLYGSLEAIFLAAASRASAEGGCSETAIRRKWERFLWTQMVPSKAFRSGKIWR